jgi:hypothetical protein
MFIYGQMWTTLPADKLNNLPLATLRALRAALLSTPLQTLFSFMHFKLYSTTLILLAS